MEKIWTNIEMPRGRKLNFEVDKLTRSIEHRITGESVHTQVLKTDKSDGRQIGKKSCWSFSWKHEKTLANRTVYKLVTVNETQFIQGLISLEIREGHVYMHLLESASHNRGNDKKYLGVAGNLVAFAGKLSFDLKCEGYVAFHAKNSLLCYYEERLGASPKGGQLMVLEPAASAKLVNQYFKK